MQKDISFCLQLSCSSVVCVEPLLAELNGNESPQTKEDKSQEEKIEEVDDDDITITHVMKKIIECVS